MQLNLIILTKTKETIRYSESFGYDGKSALNTISNDLMHVSVPEEDIEHALRGSSTFMPSHAPSKLALVCPMMPIMYQYFHAHFKSYKLLTNNQNNTTTNKSVHNPNSSIKTTNNKITPSTTK
jgi:hypothetical protein